MAAIGALQTAAVLLARVYRRTFSGSVVNMRAVVFNPRSLKPMTGSRVYLGAARARRGQTPAMVPGSRHVSSGQLPYAATDSGDGSGDIGTRSQSIAE